MDKGQGLPITTIVVAALALLVLVILFAITTGRLGIFAGGVSECPGICVAKETHGVTHPNVRPVTGAENATCKDFEDQVGVTLQYIARGVRGDDKQPIRCNACCISKYG